MKINIPNILTIFRILLTPLFIICLFYNHPYARLWALIIFIVASITDAFDGYYARKYNQVTRQGKFLDPLADKILVSSAFISFALLDLVPYWMVALIIFRDLFVTGLRMAMESKGLTMITSKIAKAKTTIQISVIIFILLYLGVQIFSYNWLRVAIQFIIEQRIIYYFTLLATISTVWTGISYLYKNRQIIKNYIF
ncbi:MAG: CDP-diacylglycerol--glycerol-3-phosphate 3-phosphatidyltransferase [Planctomycetia bacterium]|nr:CDP-diacylglycerol--glycerol-3-phosphate 3-phosphatidyltransferase [Planctomycetia bacterium]